MSRAVLVTGAAKGLGQAITRALDVEGYRVFAGVRSEADAEALRTETPDRITPLMLDVTVPTQIAAARETIERQLGAEGLFGLVNSAGIVVAGPLEYLPLDRLREQFEVNVFGPMALTQALLPMLRRAQGRIVNISSINGRVATPFSGAYAASKFALEALSDALRRELGRAGVTVTLIEPGAFRTPIWDTSRERAKRISAEYPPAAQEHYGRVLSRLADVRTPSRAGDPATVAAVVVKALARRTPRTRYLVGMDARIGAALAWLLPDRVFDRLLQRRRGP